MRFLSSKPRFSSLNLSRNLPTESNLLNLLHEFAPCISLFDFFKVKSNDAKSFIPDFSNLVYFFLLWGKFF